jgi:tRNA G18 (ribose-2'-O)-methylase SpoU
MKQEQLTFRQKHADLKQSLAQIKNNRHPVALLCDHLTDPANLGILFRLADAARLQEIIFFNEPDFEITPKINRISRQTIQYVPHRIFHDFDAIKKLKNNYEIIALEYTNQSILYTEYRSKRPILLILGNEQAGVSDQLLALSDKSIHLPMHGINSSMNVSMAAGISAFHLIKNL